MKPMEKELQKYYDAGKECSAAGANMYENFVKRFKATPVGGSQDWVSFVNGWAEVQKEIHDKKRVELKIDDFLDEIRAVCEKYEVSITSCDDGAYICAEDFEEAFNLHT